MTDDDDWRAESTDIRLGLWGSAGSGKTTFLGMLYYYIQDMTAFSIRPASDETADLVRQFYERTMIDGVMPDPTPADSDRSRTYSYRLFTRAAGRFGLPPYWRTGRPISAEITFVDSSGSWYREPKGMQAKYSRTHAEDSVSSSPIDWLRSSQGIVCLLDSEVALGATPSNDREWPDRDETCLNLDDLFQLLAGRERYISQTVAICLSKVDTPGAWARRGKPYTLAQQILPHRVLSTIVNSCDPARTRWFAVSSVGPSRDADARPGRGIDPQNNRVINARDQMEPHNLFGPVGWLLSRLAGEHGWLAGQGTS